MSEDIACKTLEVRKDNWASTRVVDELIATNLPDNAVILRIDRQALTANNISYAGAGDLLGYWKFFPAEEGWGRIPAMGWADVIHSRHPEVAEGERVWGFFPFATHLQILAGQVSGEHFTDVSPHRADLAPVYARFDRASANPVYEAAREDHDSLLRGLFMTSWLVEDFLHEAAGFGAKSCVVTSASSKTSISLAHCLRKRGALRTIGLTSPGNVAFCQSLGLYDAVHTYDQTENLDASEAVVSVDMAGSAMLLTRLHQHYKDNLKHSCQVGATHYEEGGTVSDLPGATPEFFFAPSHIQTRSAEVGAARLMLQLGADYVEFRNNSDNWLNIERHNGPTAVEQAYQAVLAGKTDPRSGQIVSMAL